MAQEFLEMPDKDGFFGEFGGQMIPPELKAVMDDIANAYEEDSQLQGISG